MTGSDDADDADGADEGDHNTTLHKITIKRDLTNSDNIAGKSSEDVSTKN